MEKERPLKNMKLDLHIKDYLTMVIPWLPFPD